jgi:hypothetical protein
MADAGANMPRDRGSSGAAEEIQEDLLNEQHLSEAAREELFFEERGGVRKRVPPALFIDAAESKNIFRGLNGSRRLLGVVDDAVQATAKDPKRVEDRYREMVPAPESKPHGEAAPERPEAEAEPAASDDWITLDEAAAGDPASGAAADEQPAG